MLSRVLEPEVMDSAEEARDYDAMDHSAVNRVFADDFLAAWDGVGAVLDVGAGTALIPIELARRSPGIQITAIDLARHMLAVAAENVRRAGLENGIRLECWDAKDLPTAAGSFGAVISNSIIHHIPEPGPVLAGMVRAAAVTGTIFVRDLVRPPDETELRRLVALHTVGANDHQRKMFDDSLRAALSLEEIRGLVAGLGCDPAQVRMTSDRHWTWSTRKPA
jgi:ubiquinone/menaquinone biosynthesis C-methylase UbiE